MSNIHQEETLGKAYDSRLMKRLLSYAKPYWLYLFISISLLMVVTASDLARPYLLQIAIDDYISGYKQPMYVFDNNEAPVEGIEFNNKVYIREGKLDNIDQSALDNKPIETLVKIGGSFYLVEGRIGSEDVLIVDSNNSYFVEFQGTQYNANKLSKEEYNAFRDEDISGLSRIGLTFLGIILIGFVFNYIQVYILNYTSQKIIYNIRQELFSHLQKMSLSYFDKNPVGRLVTRVTNDTETLNEMYTGVLVNLFKDLFLLVGIVFIMLRMNVRLALILIAAIIFKAKVRTVYREVRVKLAQINSSLNENITGMRIVHIFKKENKKFQEFDKINTDYLGAAKKEIFLYAVFRPTIEIIRSLGIALIIWYGGRNVIGNVLEFGVLYAFITYLQKFFEPILDLTEKYNILQSAMASSERLFQILDKDEDIKNSSDPLSIKEVQGKIEFKNVWFAYEGENWVLRDVSFTINPGEAVAFVGATGAGKSSIINLINRFYDIQKGEILIDGINIKDIDKYQLRKHIGVVLQDVFLFTGNIRENIRLNDLSISDKDVENVAKYVNAHNFINNLPNKYDEKVMERGSTLSSGQRQLLAFARALAFNPSVLVLDEATSNIDTETEVLIQDALLKLIKGRTTIAVAHRLSTIQHSDKIILLHKGKIREMGTHQELLNKEGMYFDLYRLQYKEEFDKSTAQD